jgi:nucleoside-diphosphate-sugar epimerase
MTTPWPPTQSAVYFTLHLRIEQATKTIQVYSINCKMSQTALVTGGTGFIALYVVKLLLKHGHHVHTTVRSLANKKKCKSLLELQTQYPDKLTLFEADLLSHGSFFQAMQGCDTVYHIASPFLVPQQIKDGMKDCVEPALNGTRNVLVSVNDTESVRRVILTSSSK